MREQRRGTTPRRDGERSAPIKDEQHHRIRTSVDMMQALPQSVDADALGDSKMSIVPGYAYIEAEFEALAATLMAMSPPPTPPLPPPVRDNIMCNPSPRSRRVRVPIDPAKTRTSVGKGRKISEHRSIGCQHLPSLRPEPKNGSQRSTTRFATENQRLPRMKPKNSLERRVATQTSELPRTPEWGAGRETSAMPPVVTVLKPSQRVRWSKHGDKSKFGGLESTRLGGAFDELAIEAVALGVDDHILTAAESFDSRQDILRARAHSGLEHLSARPDSRRTGNAFDAALAHVRLNRFVMPAFAASSPVAMASSRKIVKRKRQSRWRLSDSCWKSFGDATDMFETPQAARRLFDADWAIASNSHELRWFIIKHHFEPAKWRSLNKNGDHEEVREVREELWRHHHILYGVFEYYCVLYSETETSKGEPDVFSMSFNAWMNFVSAAGMVTKQCPHSEFQTIFAVVDATDAKIASIDMMNSSRALSRAEFLQAIVRCAVRIHFLERQAKIVDVSDTVKELIMTKMVASLPAAAMQKSNTFRKLLCYTERCTAVLEAALPSLRAMYEKYACVSQTVGDTMRDDEMMSIGEWLAMVDNFGLVSSGHISRHEAKLIFMRSRVREATEGHTNALQTAADALAEHESAHNESQRVGKMLETSAAIIRRSERRLRHMGPRDFMEAVVRLATAMSLPTDMEVEESGAKDAGAFLTSLQKSP